MKYNNPTGLPSISDIIGPYEDMRWCKEEHRQRGEIVHGWIAADLLDLYAPHLPTGMRGYVESYLAFKPHIKEIIIVEKRLSSERGFCGQLDLLATLDEAYNNLTALLDWKTAKAAMKSWSARLGGYSILAKENGLPVRAGATVRLRGEESPTKGFFPLVDYYDEREMKENEIIFLSAYHVHRNLLSNGKLYASYETIKQEY